MTPDIAVIGAGPAGLSAAIAAAEAGAQVLVVDEYPRLGGQFYKRAAPAFELRADQLSREHALGEALRHQVKQKRIEVMPNALAWGAFERTVMVQREGRSQSIRAGALVLATGAYERPVPFRGWTLPGVMSAGGAQTLARTQWVMPGQRMVLAGAGPFLLPVAQQLLRAGVEIVAILEATRPRDWLPGAPALWGQWPRFAEAWDYWRSLRAARVPVKYRHRIIAAEGTERVSTVTVARVDADWRVLSGSERSIEADGVAVGYGFLPNTELAELLGCELYWDSHAAAWFVTCDEAMSTSASGVFAAGEITGIGGSAVALEEGRVAGLAAAAHVGAISTEDCRSRAAPARRRLARRRRFAAMLNRVFTPRPGLWEGMVGDVLVCRCEEVTVREVRGVLREGCTTPKQIKDWTRAGMGLCQGRMCRAAVAQLIREETGLDGEEISRPHVRPPVKPVPMSVLAGSELPDEEGR